MCEIDSLKILVTIIFIAGIEILTFYFAEKYKGKVSSSGAYDLVIIPTAIVAGLFMLLTCNSAFAGDWGVCIVAFIVSLSACLMPWYTSLGESKKEVK